MKNFGIFVFALAFFVFLSSVGDVRAQEKPSDEASGDRQTEQTKPDTPLTIKRKPGASAELCEQNAGIAAVRVTFDKSAKVTNAELVRESGCKMFDARAIKAAKKIKFTPAMKNGEPVTVTKLIEYTYRRY